MHGRRANRLCDRSRGREKLGTGTLNDWHAGAVGGCARPTRERAMREREPGLVTHGEREPNKLAMHVGMLALKREE